MKIEYAELSDDNLGLVGEFACNTVWQRRQWSPSFTERYIAWRFPDRPAGFTLLAADQGRCVGVLDCITRKYQFGDTVIDVGEPCDWFCESSYRTNLVGLRLMRKLMQKSRLPLVVVGGTEMTQNILPRLGWRPLATLYRYILPTRAGPAIEKLARRWGVAHPENLSAIRAVGRVSIRRKLFRELADNEVVSVRPLGSLDPEHFDRVRTGSDAMGNRLTAADVEWLERAPEEPGAAFVCVVGKRDADTFGFCLSRIYPTKSGIEAKILHLQMSQGAEILVDDLIRKTTEELIDRGAGHITCRFSDPQVCWALRRNGFWNVGKATAFWWSETHSDAPNTILLTGATADEAFLPRPRNLAF